MTKLLEQIFEWSKKCDHKNKDIKVLKLFEGGYTIQCSGCGQIVTHKESSVEENKNVVEKKENV